MAERCSWCGTDPVKAAKRHEGPHATWCPHYRRPAKPPKLPLVATHKMEGENEVLELYGPWIKE